MTGDQSDGQHSVLVLFSPSSLIVMIKNELQHS